MNNAVHGKTIENVMKRQDKIFVQKKEMVETSC
jgi:hypothetical protein